MKRKLTDLDAKAVLNAPLRATRALGVNGNLDGKDFSFLSALRARPLQKKGGTPLVSCSIAAPRLCVQFLAQFLSPIVVEFCRCLEGEAVHASRD